MKSSLAMLLAGPALVGLLHGCAAGGVVGAASGIGQAAAGAAVNSAAGAMVNSATGALTGSAGGAAANSVAGTVTNSATGAVVNSATGAITETATGAMAGSAGGAMTGAAGAAVNSATGAAVQSATGAMAKSALGAATAGQSAVTNAFIQTMATSVINGQIGQQVKSADQNFRLQRLGELMQSGNLEQPQQWYNPQSGNTLAVRPLGPEVTDPSRRQPCRDLEETYGLAAGQQLRELRRACKDPSGQWTLVQ